MDAVRKVSAEPLLRDTFVSIIEREGPLAGQIFLRR